LEQTIYSFLKQDYPPELCNLIILDDAGQYIPQEHTEPKRWSIAVSPRRFRTFGEKCNAVVAMAPPDTDAIVVWDDDDIYLPHTLRAHATALENATFSRPSVILKEAKGGNITLRWTKMLFHAAWAYRVELFNAVGGYPWIQSGQDQGFRDKIRKAKGFVQADPLEYGFAPYFVHRWLITGCPHLSSGTGNYEKFASLADKIEKPIEKLNPHWPRDYTKI